MKPTYPQVIRGMASMGPTTAAVLGHMQDVLHPTWTGDLQMGSQQASPEGARENQVAKTILICQLIQMVFQQEDNNRS